MSVAPVGPRSPEAKAKGAEGRVFPGAQPQQGLLGPSQGTQPAGLGLLMTSVGVGWAGGREGSKACPRASKDGWPPHPAQQTGDP